MTLDRNAPQLFAYPERRFQYLGKVKVPLVEALVIPVYLGEDRPGTIWIVAHNDEVKFDSEDLRLMTGLAEFTSCALRLTQAYDQERKERAEGSKQLAVHEEKEEAMRAVQAKLEAMVQSRTAQLQQLSSRLMAMQDDERRRIARELHDSAGQYLAGIHMNLQALLRETSSLSRTDRERVTDSLTMSEQCTSEIRTISYLLHPPLLDEVGLASAIYWYVDGFSQRSGIRVELQIEEGIRELPDELKNALFRVVQQSLANIHRHSGSEVAQIRINIDAESLIAEICDEGRGIPEETLKGFHDGTRLPGVGIAGMRERIRDMGGLFEVRSSAKGTTIAVRMPLPAEFAGYECRAIRAGVRCDLRFPSEAKMAECKHLNHIHKVTPQTNGCEECLKMGDTWVHLRLCMECGHVGCCDSSKNKHATKHFHKTTHPIMKSIEPGESWGWCYVDEVELAF